MRILVAAALLAAATAASAQEVPAGGGPATLGVFLDCHGPCDFDYFRREITFVNWLRDRQDASVHLLVTSQGTGGGGQRYTLRFIGLRDFSGIDDEFSFASRQSDTFDEIRALLAQRISLGLARYAARGDLAGRLQVRHERAAGDSLPEQPQPDPWKLWVLTLSGSANLSGESKARYRNFSGFFRARRITETWKLSASIRGSRNTGHFELEDGEIVRSHRSDYTLALLGIRSLGPHWSFGLNGGARRSSHDNYDLLVRFAPGLEFDVYPYSESSQREFVFVYEVGIVHANYHEETIYSKLEETRLSHALTAAVEAVQPWGSVDARITGLSYLDDWKQNRLNLNGGVHFRIFRGLNLNLNAYYSRVRDQLSLSKAGVSDEEVLLRLKQLRTSYFYGVSFGFDYTFGSKFNNIVNPRFNSSSYDF
jgi:hypothetical protein